MSLQRASAAEERQQAAEFPLLQEGKGAPIFPQHPIKGLQTGREFLGLLSAPRTHILLLYFLFLKFRLGNVSGEDHNLICNIMISSSDNSPSWLRPCSLSQFCSVGCAEGAGVTVQWNCTVSFPCVVNFETSQCLSSMLIKFSVIVY